MFLTCSFLTLRHPNLYFFYITLHYIGSHTILVFSAPNLVTIFRQWQPNGASTAGRVWKKNIAIFDQYLAYLWVSSLRRRMQSRRNATHQWIFTWMMYASTNWYGRSMLITASVDFVYIYQSTVTPKRTEQNLFVRVGKSLAAVFNNRRLIIYALQVLYAYRWS